MPGYRDHNVVSRGDIDTFGAGTSTDNRDRDGVAGTRESLVAAALAEFTGWTMAGGDDFHPSANVEKMRAGRPLDTRTDGRGCVPSPTGSACRSRVGAAALSPARRRNEFVETCCATVIPQCASASWRLPARRCGRASKGAGSTTWQSRCCPANWKPCKPSRTTSRAGG